MPGCLDHDVVHCAECRRARALYRAERQRQLKAAKVTRYKRSPTGRWVKSDEKPPKVPPKVQRFREPQPKPKKGFYVCPGCGREVEAVRMFGKVGLRYVSHHPGRGRSRCPMSCERVVR